MTRARLLAFLALGVSIACGGGPGSGSGTGVPPISIHDPPPPSSDPPGTTYESPGSSEDPAGNEGSACTPCDEELSCAVPEALGAQASTLFLRSYKGGCVVSEGGGSEEDPVLECDGSVTQLSNGQPEGTWSRLPGGELELCSSSLGRAECAVCVRVSAIDGGADVVFSPPEPGVP